AASYDPNGDIGECGIPQQLLDFIAALSSADYRADALCGQHIDLTSKHVDVIVGDLCPGCGARNLDLSEGAFRAALADVFLGKIPVEWQVVAASI
ncbi:RlpA-like double-psi beta-barrel-protein domain-containing protein-containing protein, partial [Mycena olivaceomarginata]